MIINVCCQWMVAIISEKTERSVFSLIIATVHWLFDCYIACFIVGLSTKQICGDFNSTKKVFWNHIFITSIFGLHWAGRKSNQYPTESICFNATLSCFPGWNVTANIRWLYGFYWQIKVALSVIGKHIKNVWKSDKSWEPGMFWKTAGQSRTLALVVGCYFLCQIWWSFWWFFHQCSFESRQWGMFHPADLDLVQSEVCMPFNKVLCSRILYQLSFCFRYN